jgi:hypothetical protein
MILFNWIFKRIAYKATYNMKCIDMTYEVGKTYTMEEDPILCMQGFHFCINPKDILYFYDYKKDFKLLEIEVLGKIAKTSDKAATNKFRVIRVVPRKETEKLLKIKTKWDKNDNLIYMLDRWRDKKYWEYDDQNREIYHTDGYAKYKYRYDEYGNKEYSKDGYQYQKCFF